MNRILAFSSLIVLAACSNADPRQPLSADFGAATAHNFAVQVVNPNPSTAPFDTDGQRLENAIVRYRTDRVNPVHLPLESGRIHGGADTMPMPLPPQ
jgi:hypothetical protein